MYNRYNSASNNNLVQNYADYLTSLGMSQNSVRFYKSDLYHFTSWLISQLKTLGVLVEKLEEALPFLKLEMAGQYRQSLLTNKTPVKTINRKLSSLRKLSEYLVKEEIFSFDFTEGMVNITSSSLSVSPQSFSLLIEEFKKHLETQKASKNTVKNYIADTRHFLSWLSSQPC